MSNVGYVRRKKMENEGNELEKMRKDVGEGEVGGDKDLRSS